MEMATLTTAYFATLIAVYVFFTTLYCGLSYFMYQSYKLCQSKNANILATTCFYVVALDVLLVLRFANAVYLYITMLQNMSPVYIYPDIVLNVLQLLSVTIWAKVNYELGKHTNGF